jgi:hypothetical protein
MWHQFSTLAKGNSVAFASPKGKDADSRHDAWRETCAAMCAWGIAHDRAYVEHLEQELGWQSGIEWDPDRPGGPPGPGRYLALHVDGSPPDLPPGGKMDSWKWAETCYGDDLAWEEGAAARVHAFLASDEGQRALRAYHR